VDGLKKNGPASELYPEKTPAHYMLFRDIPVQETLRHISPGTPITTGPYPLTFLYFDSECQLAFHEGEPMPKMVYNYQHRAESTAERSYTTEIKIPTVSKFDRNKTPDGETWTISIANPNDYPVPMGMTEWGNFSGHTVGETDSVVKEVKAIGDHLLFVRFDAEPLSTTTFSISLKARQPGVDESRTSR